jgi:hypothetical protein
MAKKKATKKEKPTPKFPEEYEGFKAGDEVTYNRVSDGAPSYGRIWHFRPDVPGRALVQMIDLILGNFQLGFFDELDAEKNEKKRKALKQKANARGR